MWFEFEFFCLLWSWIFLCAVGHFSFYFSKLSICVFFSDFLMSHIFFSWFVKVLNLMWIIAWNELYVANILLYLCLVFLTYLLFSITFWWTKVLFFQAFYILFLSIFFSYLYVFFLLYISISFYMLLRQSLPWDYEDIHPHSVSTFLSFDFHI